MTFQIHPLDPAPFRHLFALSDDELVGHRAVRMSATSKPGFPCRVSLADAEIGEPLILVNYVHQPADTPYHAAHAVFIREGAHEAGPAPGAVPEVLRIRTLSLRAFDGQGMVVDAEVVDGKALAPRIDHLLALSDVAEVHIHFAAFGCFAARATRAG